MSWQLSALSPRELSDICSTCRQITFEMFFEGFEHSLDYRQTIESGRFCKLCRLMICSYARLQVHYNAYEAERNYESIATVLPYQKAVERVPQVGNAQQQLGPIKEELVEAPKHLTWIRHGHWQKINGTFSNGCTIQISAPEDSTYLSENMIELREIQEANSLRNTSLLYHWLHTCIDDHPQCHRLLGGLPHKDNDDGPLPTRVIYVGSMDGSEAPRLLETKGKTGSYTALSHRWGSKPKLRLTRANCNDFMSSLPVRDLPLTYKDAISVTRSLGKRYIWIDSLCIVQDDENDWTQEAKRMGDIFERAVCTIAAIDAIDDKTGEDRGLFMARQEDPLAVRIECVFNEESATPPSPNDPFWESTFQHLPFASTQPDHNTIVLRPRWKGLWQTIQDTQWVKRGWILQERLLSRRIIYYTNRKIFWECQLHSSDEENRLTDSLSMRKHLVDTFGQFVSSWDYAEEFSAWWHQVEDYSSCLLTRESDKLAALQGLCSRIKRCIREPMFAGMILDEKGANLLWRVKDTAVSYTQFHAPSWSWAALEASIRYNDYCIDGSSQWLLSELRLNKPSECMRARNGTECKHGVCGIICFKAPFTVLVAAESFEECKDQANEAMIKILGSAVHYESQPIPRQERADTLTIPARELSLPGRTQVLRVKGSDEIVGWILQDVESNPSPVEEVICAAIVIRQALRKPPIVTKGQAIKGFNYVDEQNIDFIALKPHIERHVHRRIGRGRIVAAGWIDRLGRSRFKVS